MARIVKLRSGGELTIYVSDYMALDTYDREFVNALLSESDQYEADIATLAQPSNKETQ